MIVSNNITNHPVHLRVQYRFGIIDFENVRLSQGILQACSGPTIHRNKSQEVVRYYTRRYGRTPLTAYTTPASGRVTRTTGLFAVYSNKLFSVTTFARDRLISVHKKIKHQSNSFKILRLKTRFIH